jgi:hypothetical protein
VNLEQWQEQMVGAVYGDANACKTFVNQLNDNTKISKDFALGIYQNNCRSARLATLQQTYKVCRQLIGEDAFRHAASLYIANTPSTAHDLNYYGDGFPTYLASLNDSVNTKKLSYLGDMAKYEHLIHQLYYALSPQACDQAVATSSNVNALLVGTAPHCRLFSSSCPIVEIWTMHEENNIRELDLSVGHQQYYLLCRNAEFLITPNALDKAEYQLIMALSSQPMLLTSFVALAESLSVELDTLLPSWISYNWITLSEVTGPGKTNMHIREQEKSGI